MTKLTDEDIMGVINNQRISDNFLSYVMIGLWVICIGFCIFETVVRILMIIRKQKTEKNKSCKQHQFGINKHRKFYCYKKRT